MTTSQRAIDGKDRYTELLTESCAIYSEINSLYQKLEAKISSSPQVIANIVTQLNSQQLLAKNIDDNIKQTLNQDDNLTTDNEPLLKRREILLEDSLVRNKAVAQKATAIKSHLQHETSSINTNRHAINGYRVPEIKNRNLINSRF